MHSHKKKPLYIRVLLNSLLVVLSMLFTLLLCEWAVRIIIPQDKMVTWLEMHEEGFMMNQINGNSFQELDTRIANYAFTKQRLRATEKGRTTEKRILAIGDSFTFGLLLDEENTYIHHLNQEFLDSGNDSTFILNGGVGGAGLADWPLWLETFGETIRPDKVLYFLNVHDIDRALSKNLFVLQNDSLIQSKRWKPQQFMFSLGKKGWYRWLQAHSQLANIVVKVLWKNVYFDDVTNNFDSKKSSTIIPNYDEFSLESNYSTELGMALIERMQNWCASNNCELIVTTTGYFEQNKSDTHTAKFYNSILTNGLAYELPFYDNSPCVDSLASHNLDGIRIPGDSHPNEEGASIIAECTWQWLPSVLE